MSAALSDYTTDTEDSDGGNDAINFDVTATLTEELNRAQVKAQAANKRAPTVQEERDDDSEAEDEEVTDDELSSPEQTQKHR